MGAFEYPAGENQWCKKPCKLVFSMAGNQIAVKISQTGVLTVNLMPLEFDARATSQGCALIYLISLSLEFPATTRTYCCNLGSDVLGYIGSISWHLSFLQTSTPLFVRFSILSAPCTNLELPYVAKDI